MFTYNHPKRRPLHALVEIIAECQPWTARLAMSDPSWLLLILSIKGIYITNQSSIIKWLIHYPSLYHV